MVAAIVAAVHEIVVMQDLVADGHFGGLLDEGHDAGQVDLLFVGGEQVEVDVSEFLGVGVEGLLADEPFLEVDAGVGLHHHASLAEQSEDLVHSYIHYYAY